MRFKTTLLAFILVLPCVSLGQSKISLTFDSDASRLVFTSAGWPTGLPSNPSLIHDKKVEFPLGTLAPSDNLVVWDRDSNNAAIRLVKGITSAWNVRDIDYRYVGLLKLRVEHEGAPLAAAQVELSDKERTKRQLVDPDSDGTATFFGITPGEFKVVVHYRSAGKEEVLRQGFEVALKREKAEPLFAVSVQDDVQTLTPKASKPVQAKQETRGLQTKPSSESPAADPVLKIEHFALGLAAGLGLIWAITRYLKKNQDVVAAHLKGMGAVMPEPPATPPGAGPIASDPVRPEPVQKIILEDSHPTPIAGGSPSAVVATGTARIVKDSGETVELQDGENLVGRETGLAVSLPNESTVSRRHAVLTLAGDTVVLKDLGSTNGTFVNGAKIDTERALSAGDSVQFGQVRFRFER